MASGAAFPGDLVEQFAFLIEPLRLRTETIDGQAWARLWEVFNATLDDPKIAASPLVREFVEVMRELAGDALTLRDVGEVLAPLDGLLPKGAHGAKFQGRKAGALGPLRREVRKALKKSPSAKNGAIWEALRVRKLKGWQFFDNPQGRYVEIDSANEGRKSTSYESFRNTVSLERKGLKRV